MTRPERALSQTTSRNAAREPLPKRVEVPASGDRPSASRAMRRRLPDNLRDAGENRRGPSSPRVCRHSSGQELRGSLQLPTWTRHARVSQCAPKRRLDRSAIGENRMAASPPSTTSLSSSWSALRRRGSAVGAKRYLIHARRAAGRMLSQYRGTMRRFQRRSDSCGSYLETESLRAALRNVQPGPRGVRRQLPRSRCAGHA